MACLEVSSFGRCVDVISSSMLQRLDGQKVEFPHCGREICASVVGCYLFENDRVM